MKFFWPFSSRRDGDPLRSGRGTWTDLLDEIQNISRGDTISLRDAGRQPTTFSSIRAISAAVSTLPVKIYEGEKNKREEVTGPLWKLVAQSPRPNWTANRFWEWVTRVHLKHGRAVAVIVRAPSGRAVGLQPLSPNSITVDLVERDGWQDIRYRYSSSVGQQTYWPEDVLDFTFGLADDMVTAISPLKELLPYLSLVNDLHEYARNAFNGTPPLIMQTREGSNIDVGTGAAIDAAKTFTKLLKRAQKDGTRALPVPPGFEAKNIGITAEQLQLSQIGRYVSDDSARGFQISPAFLGDLAKSSYRSAEAAALHFVKFVVAPITASFQQEVDLKLLHNERVMRFDFAEFLRGDLKTLADALNLLRMGGFISSNEGRRRLGEPDSDQPGADDLVQQLAMAALVPDENEEDEDEDQGNPPLSDEP